ncbi:MAG: class I SAM-dependent methyltransferase [Oscillospiraceae bacterium]|nr:class I SAM-dependent methyltransferase [Oscillospiraceae bacterium]
MNDNELRQQWLMEEATPMQGWDFSRLDGRWSHEDTSWDYAKIIRSYLKPGHVLLDMGTGDGTFLLALGHPHHLTHVTETYQPNVELCLAKLKPLGIDVKQVFDDGQLPFADGIFDIVINRHESFCAQEVNRLLKPGGLFITQQVGGQNGADLRTALMPGSVGQHAEHTLQHNIELIQTQGFELLMQEEAFPISRFYDIGAIVYYAKIIEWEFPGFSVQSCFSQLCDLQRQLDAQGFIENRQHRFIFAARKPVSA